MLRSLNNYGEEIKKTRRPTLITSKHGACAFYAYLLTSEWNWSWNYNGLIKGKHSLWYIIYFPLVIKFREATQDSKISDSKFVFLVLTKKMAENISNPNSWKVPGSIKVFWKVLRFYIIVTNIAYSVTNLILDCSEIM